MDEDAVVTADGATIRVPADSISTIFYADQQEPIGSLEIEVKQGTMAAQMAHDELVQVTFERDLWRRVAEGLQQKLDELTARTNMRSGPRGTKQRTPLR